MPKVNTESIYISKNILKTCPVQEFTFNLNIGKISTFFYLNEIYHNPNRIQANMDIIFIVIYEIQLYFDDFIQLSEDFHLMRDNCSCIVNKHIRK